MNGFSRSSHIVLITSDAKTLLERKERRVVVEQSLTNAHPRVHCDASKATQADAASLEFCLQRSTPAVMNQIACPSITRPKPCTLSRMCPERTPTMVRGPRIQP